MPPNKKPVATPKRSSSQPSTQTPSVVTPAVVVSPASTTDVTGHARVLRLLIGKLPPLDGTTRAAFRSLATDAQRSALGRQTKARGVLADGVAMAVAIDHALATFPDLEEAYPAARRVYFLEGLLALDAVVQASSSHEDKVGAARGVAVGAYDQAVKARGRLLKRLERYAGQREDKLSMVAALPTQGRGNNDLRYAIERATALADIWIGDTSPSSVAIAAGAMLTRNVIDQAREAAAALDDANVDVTVEGHRNVKDPPIVNLEEGNVLLAMRHAMDVFQEAHDDNDVVPRLIAGPATRRVLARRPHATTEPATEPTTSTTAVAVAAPIAPTGATPAAASTAPTTTAPPAGTPTAANASNGAAAVPVPHS